MHISTVAEYHNRYKKRSHSYRQRSQLPQPALTIDRMDRESRDLARREQRTPKKSATPQKSASKTQTNADENLCESEKENCDTAAVYTKLSRTRLNFSAPVEKDGDKYGHPVYKEISLKNGYINKQDLSTLKRLCKVRPPCHQLLFFDSLAIISGSVPDPLCFDTDRDTYRYHFITYLATDPAQDPAFFSSDFQDINKK